MSETESQFKGIRGFLWLAVGFLLLAAALGSAIYIVVHLLSYGTGKSLQFANSPGLAARIQAICLPASGPTD